MSNFDVQYNFIAIDRFSKVARKIQKEYEKLNKGMKLSSQSMEMQGQTLGKTSQQFEKTAKKISTVGKVTTQTATQTDTGMKKLVKSIRHGARGLSELTEKAAKYGDMLAFKGYIQFMNVGLPMMMIGKLGMTYSDQIENAQLQLSTMFSKQKDFHKLSQQINEQALKLSFHSRFTKEQIIATSAQIGTMTNNLKLAKDLTPLALGYSVVTQQTPQAAAEKLLSTIRAGGALPGTGVVLPKGQGAAMAQVRYQMLQRMLKPEMMKALAIDTDSATASLHKMMGQMQKLAGTMLISAEPALKSMAKSMSSLLAPIIKFMNHHQKLTGDLVKGAMVAMTFTLGITLLGATLTAIMMPIQLLVKTIKLLELAYLGAAGAAKLFGMATATAAAEEATASATIGAASLLGMGAAAGMVGLGLGAVGAGAYWLYHHQKAQKRGIAASNKIRNQLSSYESPLFKQSQTQLSQMFNVAPSKQAMEIAGFKNFPLQKNQVDVNIKVDQEGKVTHVKTQSSNKNLNVTNPFLNLGTNMGHIYG